MEQKTVSIFVALMSGRYEAIGRLIGYMVNRREVMPRIFSPFAMALVCYGVRHVQTLLCDVIDPEQRFHAYRVSCTYMFAYCNTQPSILSAVIQY